MTTGIIGEITPTGSGHINDSYSVATHSSGAPVYLLQRINHGIFRDVPQLMENILNVSRHVAHKLTEKDQLTPATRRCSPLLRRAESFFSGTRRGITGDFIISFPVARASTLWAMPNLPAKVEGLSPFFRI